MHRIRHSISALIRLTFVALAAGLLPTALPAQAASFGGTVLIDPSEKPLANAEIVFADLNRSTRSDSVGNFKLTGLPLGRHTVIVRLVGYESITTDVTLTNGRPVEVDLLLKPLTTKLSTVEVKAAASPYAIKLADFEARRETKTGRYITADVFEKNDGRPVSAIITEMIPGVKAVPVNGRRFLASLRGGKMTSCGQGACGVTMEKIPPGCYMQVIVNGMVRFNGTAGQAFFDVDELNAKDIIGFEFYTTATTPTQYRATGGESQGACGTVIIWTKG